MPAVARKVGVHTRKKIAFEPSWPWKEPKSEGRRQNEQGGASHLALHLPSLREGITLLSRRPKGKHSQSRAQQELFSLHLLVTCGPRLADLAVTVSSRLVKRIREAKKSSQARQMGY